MERDPGSWPEHGSAEVRQAEQKMTRLSASGIGLTGGSYRETLPGGQGAPARDQASMRRTSSSRGIGMGFLFAAGSRPPFFRGSFSARQRSPSESPSQPIERGARCQLGLPGTPLEALFSL